MRYVIKGDPVAWARAGRCGTRMYDTQKNLKIVLGIMIRNQHNDLPLYTGPLQLLVTFYMKTPQRIRNLKKFEGKFTHTKPDLSNLIKFIEDTCTGILYHDDALIASINADRRYSFEPRTEFIIRQLDEEKNLPK